MNEYLECCPLCSSPLRNGQDSKQHIGYPPEKMQEFIAGTLSIEQLNEFAIITYDRPRLCANSGNQNTFTDLDGTVKFMNPPCPNFYGGKDNIGTIENPVMIVETIKINDN